MAKQSSTEALKERIRLLEIKQAETGAKIKEQFNATAESLKPVNLIRSSLAELTASHDILTTLIESATLLLSGVASKRLIDSSKGGSLIKLLTSLLQLIGSALLSVYRDSIQDFILGLIAKFSKKAGTANVE